MWLKAANLKCRSVDKEVPQKPNQLRID